MERKRKTKKKRNPHPKKATRNHSWGEESKKKQNLSKNKMGKNPGEKKGAQNNPQKRWPQRKGKDHP